MRAQLIILALLLSGCAITEEERHERLLYVSEIETAFEFFVSDSDIIDGHLYVPRTRVSNAPPTVWEKTRAQCWYTNQYGFQIIERIEI